MYPLIRVEEEVKKVFEDFSLSMRFFFRVIPRNSSYSAKKNRRVYETWPVTAVQRQST